LKLWQHVLLAALALATAYLLWRSPDAGVATIFVGACAAWLGRSIYRSKLAKNPMGENRDYSLRPAVVAAAKCLGSFAAALLWTMLTAYSVRRGYVSDTWSGFGVLFAPALVLLIVAATYLVKAMVGFHFGGKPPEG
jgi:hypothetical protein